MKIFLIMMIFFLSSCTSNLNNKYNTKFDFSEELSLDQFILKLKDYAENSSYPNIDN